MWSQYAMVALEKASALTGAAYYRKSQDCVVALHCLQCGLFAVCPCANITWWSPGASTVSPSRWKRTPNPTATSKAVIKPALRPVALWDSLALEGAEAAVGEEAWVSTKH